MINAYRKRFPQRHTVLPVVHVTSLEQAIRNVEIAINAGADGCFLINHTMTWQKLIEIHQTVSEQFPGFWIGVNLLDLFPNQALNKVPHYMPGLWMDSYDANRVDHYLGLLFGGVAFKYQAPVADVAAAARQACQYMDVVVTSGVGTGKAPPVAKIKSMKEAIGDFPLAIASGITTRNIIDFLPYADSFMVATGISASEDELDPGLTDVLVRMVRAYDEPIS